MKFTVFGSRGFIGRHMCGYLQQRGIEVDTPSRDQLTAGGRNLGHVIYAIGLTGNFRTRPGAAIEAHVNLLHRLIGQGGFESWLYLSSTRVYGRLPLEAVATEEILLPVQPSGDAVYDLSKLLGEAICLSNDNPAVRVARLSNVYGADQGVETFLGSVMADLSNTGRVVFGEAPISSKDYIAIEDTVELLYKIAVSGTYRLYNVASGNALTHRMLADALTRRGYTAEFAANSPGRTFPVIGTARIIGEFGGATRTLCNDLTSLLERSREFHSRGKTISG